MNKIEKLGIESAALLSELSIQTFTEAYKEFHSKENLAAYCSKYYNLDAMKALLNQTDTEVMLAIRESEPAGFYVIKHHPSPYETEVESTELKQIYILSSHFGCGLGVQLFDSAVEQAKINQSKRVWLCVSDTNYRAQAFYKKLGFSRVGIGPQLDVGSERLNSSILILNIEV